MQVLDKPCRLCHVVVVVRLSVLVIFGAIQVYALLMLMPDSPKERFQTKTDPGPHAVLEGSRFTSGTRLLIRRDCASELGTA